MAAVDNLFAHLASLATALDSVSSRQLNLDIECVALRGIAVQCLSVLEEFVISRTREWSNSITVKRLPPSSLPGGADAAHEWRARIVERLPRRFKNADSDVERANLFSEIADSLKSFNQQALVTHDIFFDWPGSNIQETDIDKAMALLGVRDAWGEMTQLWQRLDQSLPRHISARNLFVEIRNTRHSAAHNPNYNLSYISAAAVVRNLKIVALLFDCVGSAATGRILAMQTHSTQRIFQSIKVRALRKDGKVWREYTSLSHSGRAYRRHQGLSVGMSECSTRLTRAFDVLIAFDGNDVVEWRTGL